MGAWEDLNASAAAWAKVATTSAWNKAERDYLTKLGAALQPVVVPPVVTSPVVTPPPTTSINWKNEIGVNTHFRYGGQPHESSAANSPALKQLLGQLGVKLIRDTWRSDQTWIDDFVLDLHTSLGISVTFMVDNRFGLDTSPTVQRDHLKKLAASGCLHAIELANENSDVAGNRAWSRSVIDTIRASQALDAYPIYGPSIAEAYDPVPSTALGLITGIDRGVMHDYVGNRGFTNVNETTMTGTMLHGQALTDAVTDVVKHGMAAARIIAGAGKPVVATEFGASTWQKPGGNLQCAFTPDQQAELLLAQLQVHHDLGVVESYIYIVTPDEVGTYVGFESGLSLATAQTDGKGGYVFTVKPAFNAVRNLLVG